MKILPKYILLHHMLGVHQKCFYIYQTWIGGTYEASFKTNESKTLYKKLTNYVVNIELISENLDKYTGGIIIIPSYLSKGLEFDSVIISDSNKYSENILDTKLLYVACTRAMHTLDIISQ